MFGRRKKQPLNDLEVIKGLQEGDGAIEKEFYLACRAYFEGRRSGVFDSTSEAAREALDVFQDSFLTLWTEIQSKKIFIRDNYPWRIDRNGEGRKMSANLKTYLMAIAKYKNFEVLREEEIYVSDEGLPLHEEADEDPDDNERENIVRLCVEALPQRCKEILTLFYFEKKSLDEILTIRQENTSKDGLKTGKSKCMSQLKKRILEEFSRHNLKP